MNLIESEVQLTPHKPVLHNRRTAAQQTGVLQNIFILKDEHYSSSNQTLARLPPCIYVIFVTSELNEILTTTWQTWH